MQCVTHIPPDLHSSQLLCQFYYFQCTSLQSLSHMISPLQVIRVFLRHFNDFKSLLIGWEWPMMLASIVSSAWNGKTLIQREIDLMINSDTSLEGWGACCSNQRTRGPQERLMHINCLELLAETLVTKTFVKSKAAISGLTTPLQ